MSKAYGYIRVSTDQQEKLGYSLDAQKRMVEQQYNLLLTNDKYKSLKWGGVFVDGGESAFKIEFRKRKTAKVLCSKLRSGDVIIISTLDRAFRRSSDALSQMEAWHKDDITLVSVRDNIDMSTPYGELNFTMQAGFAQFESRLRSQRIKEGLAEKKRRMQAVNQKAPTGMRSVGHGKNQRYVFDAENRPVYRLIRFLREHCGLSFQQIADTVEKVLAKHERRAYISEQHFSKDRPFKKGRIQTIWKRIDVLMPRCKPSGRRKIWNKHMNGGC